MLQLSYKSCKINCNHNKCVFVKIHKKRFGVKNSSRRRTNMEIKGTKTEKNLAAAFAGESQARNKYTYFASVAKKEGYEQIAAIFEETAPQCSKHCHSIDVYV